MLDMALAVGVARRGLTCARGHERTKHIIRAALSSAAWPETAQHGMKGKAHTQAAA